MKDKRKNPLQRKKLKLFYKDDYYLTERFSIAQDYIKASRRSTLAISKVIGILAGGATLWAFIHFGISEFLFWIPFLVGVAVAAISESLGLGPILQARYNRAYRKEQDRLRQEDILRKQEMYAPKEFNYDAAMKMIGEWGKLKVPSQLRKEFDESLDELAKLVSEAKKNNVSMDKWRQLFEIHFSEVVDLAVNFDAYDDVSIAQMNDLFDAFQSYMGNEINSVTLKKRMENASTAEAYTKFFRGQSGGI